MALPVASCRLQVSVAAVIAPPLAMRRSCWRPSGQTLLAVVDTGPLYALTDDDDDDHDACVSELSRGDLRLVVPALVVAETTYLVGKRLGAIAEAAFLRGLGTWDVEGPAPEDFPRIAELVERYADFPLGGTDASVVALAERVGARALVTLDRRHFAAVKPHHVEAFDLLP